MRAILLMLTMMLFLGSANAEPSEDLVFCSKLADSRERIACYDAAARIAAARGKQAAPQAARAEGHRVPVVTKADPAPVMTVPAPFAGYYAAGGVGYGIAEPRSFSIIGPVVFTSGTENPQGWSGGGAVGYNFQSGSLVLGLELSGRAGRESDSSSGVFVVTQTNGLVTAQAPFFHEFNVDAGIHLSGRVGAAFGNTMVFAQAGIGAAHTVEAAATGAGFLCTSLVFIGSILTCTAAVSTPATFVETTQWQPSALFGIGLEQNYGSWFGRFSAQAEGIKGPAGSNDFYWTTRALGMVGFRF